mmetsp:Transcript_18332/g.70824  ORF Transcript_18332/g.70824 Transcript_18332/m.70824 type:complete len:202 (+) Transcript_18332:205-810(+)
MSDAELSGWLYKKGEAGTLGMFNWRKRFFRRQKHYLFYYKRETDPVEMNCGYICLADIGSVQPSLTSERNWAFQIHTVHRTYNLSAESGAEREYWITRLVKLVQESGSAERYHKEMAAKDPEKYLTLGKPEGFKHVAGWDGEQVVEVNSPEPLRRAPEPYRRDSEAEEPTAPAASSGSSSPMPTRPLPKAPGAAKPLPTPP